MLAMQRQQRASAVGCRHRGSVLDPTSSLRANGLQTGDQVTAIVQLPKIAATEAGLLSGAQDHGTENV